MWPMDLWFSIEIGKVLFQVTQKPQNIYMSTGYFPFQNLQKMYIFFVCPFQPQLVFRYLFFKNACQNNSKIINYWFAHESFMQK